MNTLISLVKKKLESLKIPYESVELSDKPNKKIKIVIDGKVIHFGQKNSITYLEHKDEAKRNAFHKRFKNNKGYNDPSSGLYYSARILW